MEILNVGLEENPYDIVIGRNFFEKFTKYIEKIYNGKNYL